MTLQVRFLRVLIVAGVLGSTAAATQAETVRERLWIWGHPAGVYNGSYLQPLKRASTIEPVAAAQSMGIKNMIFVRYEGSRPPPFDAYYTPFKKLDRVYWSLVAAGGGTSQTEREAAFALAEKNANLKGFILDDFFHEPVEATRPIPLAGAGTPSAPSLSPAELHALGQRQVGGRKLPLMAVIYTRPGQAGGPGHIAEVDELCLWTWRPADLDTWRPISPPWKNWPPASGSTWAVTCTISTSKPLPVAVMRRQVELGYQWLRARRIAGMIFLATPNVDVGLEAVEWTRQWIRTTGEQPLPPEGKK